MPRHDAASGFKDEIDGQKDGARMRRRYRGLLRGIKGWCKGT